MEGQFQVQELPLSDRIPPIAITSPSTPRITLSLGPIRERSTSPVSPATTAAPSPADMFPQLPLYRTNMPTENAGDQSDNFCRPREPSRRPPQLNVTNGLSINGHSLCPKHITGNDLPIPNSELILYSYAELVGTVTLAPSSDTPPSAEQARNLYTLRRELQATKPVGGGSMNIAPNSPKALAHGAIITDGTTRRNSHARSVSLSAGLLSLLSPSTLLSGPSSPPSVPAQLRRASAGHSRTPSMFSSLLATSSSIATPDLDSVEPGTDDDSETVNEPLPTFDVPPSMLAIDLVLEPGQSRTCMSKLTLLRI